MKIHQTKDASHTLFSDEFHQFYHNPNGAVTESKLVFLGAGKLEASFRKHAPVRVLEVGFGTGLNVLLLIDLWKATGSRSPVAYHSIEAHPITADTARLLNYHQFMEHPEFAGLLPHLFETIRPGHTVFRIQSFFEISIFHGLFNQFSPGITGYTHIFFDAFSPEANPDLWTPQVFEKLCRWSDPDAVLTTYCAASKARAAMVQGGWHVCRAPGVLGKREMTIASKNPAVLAGYKLIPREKYL